MQEGAILNDKHRKAYIDARPQDNRVLIEKKLNPRNDEEALKLRQFMCANFFDVRAFGAVMSTGINCGQVRGPVQFSFARSIEPIVPLEISITRMAATNEAEKKKNEASGEDDRTENRTMGRKISSLTAFIALTASSRPNSPSAPASRPRTSPFSGMP